MTSATKSVFEAFAAVMADVRSIEKGDQNTQQGFKFRGIDAVMQAVGPVLRSHGVFIIPTGQELKSETYQTRNGASMRNVTVTMQYRVYGPGGDFFDGGSFGEAADAGDKAVTKAQSVAYRTFLLQALTVPTGDVDPDAHTHERAAPRNPELDAANDARGRMLADLKPYGWTGDKLIARFKSDYDANLLEAGADTVRAFSQALQDEARAQMDPVEGRGNPTDKAEKAS